MIVTINKIEEPDAILEVTKKMSTRDKDTMNRSVRTSSAVWTGMVDGKIGCVWGITLPTLFSEQAYLWLYTTDLVKKHPFVFVRRAQIVVEELLKEYKTVVGLCLLDAKQSIRWLKWIGAEFGTPDGKVIPFKIRKK